LMEWLTPLKTKLLRKNPKWKPSCFFIDDAPQNYKHCGEFYFHSTFFFFFMYMQPFQNFIPHSPL
jgi:hypothetical protein